jgi:Regulator of ribonuclease activity B/Family of unknown function (DUF695)
MQDDWDFYPCRVDDAPASIAVNLAHIARETWGGADTLYAVLVTMAQVGPHGMGDGDEAELLYPAEDALVAAFASMGLRFVGRLRNAGTWQLAFMGPQGLASRVTAAATAAFGPLPRACEIVHRLDTDWSYYREFLFPDAERMGWIQDRRVVEQLQAQGDIAATPRRVDHWVTFATASQRAAFATAARAHAFSVDSESSEGELHAVRLWRTDAVELDHIHAVTTLLSTLATEHGGDYDGWETTIESSG